MSLPLVKGGFLVLNENSIRTMRQRLGKASELVNNDNYLPRARRVQMDCTADEFSAICKLAREADNPQHYFMKIISKAQIERTLDYVRRILKRPLQTMAYLGQRIQGTSRQWLEFVTDKIVADRYSMSEVVQMIELAQQKRQPDRYLIGILKKGLNNAR